MRRGEIALRWLLAATFAILSLPVGLSVWLAYHDTDGEKAVSADKVYRQDVMSDLELIPHGTDAAPVFRCRSARLGKRRRGMLTLGGFNTLFLDGLEINLFQREKSPLNGVSSQTEAERMLDSLGVDRRYFKAKSTLPRFSGMEITDLKINGRSADGAEFSVIAKRAEAETDGLHLHGCAIISHEKSTVLKGARIAVSPRLCLVHSEGEIDL